MMSRLMQLLVLDVLVTGVAQKRGADFQPHLSKIKQALMVHGCLIEITLACSKFLLNYYIEIFMIAVSECENASNKNCGDTGTGVRSPGVLEAPWTLA